MSRRAAAAAVACALLSAILAVAALPAPAAPPARVAATVAIEAEQDRSLRAVPAATRSALEATLGVTLESSRSLRGRFQACVLHDAENPERDRLRLDEGYLQASSTLWEGSIGRQILDWGRLDALRIVDLFRRRDWIDPIDPEDRGSWAARIDLYPGPFTVEGVWVPWFESDPIPFAPDNPFLLFPDSVSLAPLGNVAARFSEGTTREPEERTIGAETGVRVDAHLGAWDAALSLARGRDRIASTLEQGAVTIDPGATARIVVHPRHRALWMVGVDFARPLGAGTIRGEAGFFHPERITIVPDAAGGATGAVTEDEEADHARAGIGWDRRFSRGLLGKPLSVSATYAFDAAAEPLAATIDPSALRHPFRHAAFLRFRWEPTDRLAAETESLLDLDRGGESVLAKLHWSPWTGTSFEAEYRGIAGRAGSLLGRFRENDSVRIRARYAFTASSR